MNVYFDQYRGNRPGRGMRPMKRMDANETFMWKGFTWQIAGVYVCSRGIVLDVMKQISEEDFKTFQSKWKPVREKGKLTQTEKVVQRYEDPLNMDIEMNAVINGRRINSQSSCDAYYNPFEAQNEAKAFIPDFWEEELMDFYKLDRENAWGFKRINLCWDYKRIPKHMVLKLSLKKDVYRIPCTNCMETAAGSLPSAVEFSHPLTGSSHLLYVKEIKQETLPKSHFHKTDDFIYPCHYQTIEYYYDENTPDGEYLLRDREMGDKPVIKKTKKWIGKEETIGGACSIAIIVGSDSKEKADKCSKPLRYAASRLKFEPVEQTIWQINAIVKRGEEKEIEMRLQLYRET